MTTARDLFPELFSASASPRRADGGTRSRRERQLEVVLDLPPAHSEQQRKIMDALLRPGVETWVANGTKFGKTLGASNAISQALTLRTGIHRWIAPYYAQAHIGMRYVEKVLPPDPYTKKNESKSTLKLIANDATLQFFHGQDPEAIEGEASQSNVLDEAAKMNPLVYPAVKTTTTVTQGPILGISTPNGRNWFFKKCMQAKAEMEWALAKGKLPNRWFFTLPTIANPHVSAEVIAQAKKDLTDRLFRQYYLAEFVEDGAVFAFVDEAFGGGAGVIEYPTSAEWMIDSHESREVYVGVDWAKSEDSTVFYAIDDRGRSLGWKRFNRVPYPDQVAFLYQFILEVKRRNLLVTGHYAVLHDATGIGAVIDDIIKVTNTHGFEIVGLTWNNTNKEQHVSSLILAFEQKSLALVPWGTLRDELMAFEVEMTATGRPKYGAPQGLHDDCVMSLVLANVLRRERADAYAGIVVVDSLNSRVMQVLAEGRHLSLDDFD